MSRWIDADELLKKQTILNEYDEGGWDWPVNVVLVEDIKNAPAIDPESLRPRGRWIRDGDFLICLNCESEINVKNSLGVENRKNFCPNCGAKMEDGDGTQRKG